MRRVKATQVQTLQPIYVDLDACAVIARGQVHEQIAGRPERVLECTWLYFSGDLRECVEETPEKLFSLPVTIPTCESVAPLMPGACRPLPEHIKALALDPERAEREWQRPDGIIEIRTGAGL